MFKKHETINDLFTQDVENRLKSIMKIYSKKGAHFVDMRNGLTNLLDVCQNPLGEERVALLTSAGSSLNASAVRVSGAITDNLARQKYVAAVKVISSLAYLLVGEYSQAKSVLADVVPKHQEFNLPQDKIKNRVLSHLPFKTKWMDEPIVPDAEFMEWYAHPEKSVLGTKYSLNKLDDVFLRDEKSPYVLLEYPQGRITIALKSGDEGTITLDHEIAVEYSKVRSFKRARESLYGHIARVETIEKKIKSLDERANEGVIILTNDVLLPDDKIQEYYQERSRIWTDWLTGPHSKDSLSLSGIEKKLNSLPYAKGWGRIDRVVTETINALWQSRKQNGLDDHAIKRINQANNYATNHLVVLSEALNSSLDFMIESMDYLQEGTKTPTVDMAVVYLRNPNPNNKEGYKRVVQTGAFLDVIYKDPWLEREEFKDNIAYVFNQYGINVTRENLIDYGIKCVQAYRNAPEKLANWAYKNVDKTLINS